MEEDASIGSGTPVKAPWSAPGGKQLRNIATGEQFNYDWFRPGGPRDPSVIMSIALQNPREGWRSPGEVDREILKERDEEMSRRLLIQSEREAEEARIQRIDKEERRVRAHRQKRHRQGRSEWDLTSEEE